MVPSQGGRLAAAVLRFVKFVSGGGVADVRADHGGVGCV